MLVSFSGFTKKKIRIIFNVNLIRLMQVEQDTMHYRQIWEFKMIVGRTKSFLEESMKTIQYDEPANIQLLRIFDYKDLY